MNDWQLLQEFSRRGSEAAFEELVRRYANFVQLLCSRQLGDAHLSEETAQTVFTILARKAGSLSSDTVLSGWLIHTTRYACANTLRMEARRRRTEHHAAMLTENKIGRDTGVLTAAILDEGLERLSNAERRVLLLKVIEGRKLSEIASELRISVDAAEKRSVRALEKLQRFFADEKVAFGLLEGLALSSMERVGAAARDAALAKAALSGTKSIGAMTKGTLQMLLWSRMKVVSLRIAVMLLLGTGLFAMVRGGESAPVAEEDLFISPLQNEALFKQAWQTFVPLNYKNQPLSAVVEDLSHKTGIAIVIDGEYEPELDRHSPTLAGGGFNGSTVGPGARKYLTPDAFERLKAIDCSYKYMRDEHTPTQVQELVSNVPVPLAMLIADLGRNGYEASYRKDCIYLSSHRKLLPELLITRQFHLTHPWGSIARGTMNGEPYAVRLSLLDACAKTILESTPCDLADRELWDAASLARNLGTSVSRVENKPGVLVAQLNSLKRGCEVRFDEKTSTLTITAHPLIVWMLKTSLLAELDVPSPEERTGAATAFQQTRMRQLADAAQPAESERAEISTLIAQLQSEDFDTRVAAEKALQRKGSAALKLLLDLKLNSAQSDFKDRVGRIIHAVYGNVEFEILRARCNGYFKAGCAGEVDLIYREFWCQETRQGYDRLVREFDREKTAVAHDPAALESFLKRYGFKPGTDPATLSYSAYHAAVFSRAHPRVESIRLSGNRANITYSCELPPREEQAGIKQDLPRGSSTFDMIFENQRWVAAGTTRLEDPQALEWNRNSTDVAPNGGSGVSGQTAGNTASMSAGAWAVAYSFGY